MRFLYSGIGCNLIVLGLSVTSLSAVAAPVPPQAANTRVALEVSDRVLIRGNGVEFTVPAGFQGGSPSSAETKAMIAETAKIMPSMKSFVSLLDSNPDMLRAIATSRNPRQNPGLVLVTRLPIPADVSLESLGQMMAKLMPSMLPPQFKLVDTKIETVGSRQIVKMSIDAKIRGIEIKESIGLFREGDDIYQVTYVYSTEQARQANPIFEQIVDSFKASPTVAAQSPII